MIYALLKQNMFNFSTITVPSPGRFPDIWCAFCWQFHHFRNISLPFCWPFNYASVENFIIITYQTFPGRFMTISSHFVHAFKTVSWPSQIFFKPFPGHFTTIFYHFMTIEDASRPFFWQFKTICCQFSDYFLAVSRPRLSHFPCKPFLLRKPIISQTIPNSLSSFGPFPDHLTPFRAVSWPFPDHLRPLHDHFRLFPDQFTTIHAVSLPFQDISGPLQ